LSAPAASIVVPTRNRRPWLEETVASVLGQTLGSWELIAVDDASTDDTAAWLAACRDPRIRTLRLEQPSERARARNRGLERARADSVLFLDDDDTLPPDALEVHLAALRDRPEAAASIGGWDRFRPDGTRVRRRLVTRTQQRRIWDDVLFGWSAPFGQILVRTAALRDLGGWNERDGLIPLEDHELLLRLSRRHPVVLMPEVVLRYREHPGQWRPADLRERLDAVRAEALAREVGPDDRPRRLFEAGTSSRRAFGAYLDARASEALGLYLRAMRLAPSAIRSSLTRRDVLVPFAKCLLGGPALRLGRRLLGP